MNLLAIGLLPIIIGILIKQIIVKKSKKTVSDERTELVGYRTSRTTYLLLTVFLSLSSLFLMYFDQHGRVPFDFLYYVGIIMSFLACLSLIIYSILYAYYNRQS